MADTNSVLREMFGEEAIKGSAAIKADTPVETPAEPIKGADAPKNPPAEEPKEVTTPKETPTDPVTPPIIEKVETELTDEQIVELLKKRKGLSIASLDDLVTPSAPVDPKVLAEQRESDKLKFALEKGIMSRSEYDSFVADRADLNALVYKDFYAQAKEDNSELTDEEIRSEFEEEYSLNAESDSAKYKRAQKRIATIGENILRSKHQNYFSLDAKYEVHENQIKSSTERAKKIADNEPAYRADVDAAVSEAAKVVIPFSDTESYEVTISSEELNEVKGAFLDKATMEKQILDGTSKNDIKTAIKMAVLEKSLPKIVQSVTAKILLEKSKGASGVQPITLKEEGDTISKLTDKEKRIAQEMGLLTTAN